ncbi:SusC/RagA family TonB-linked outer membrane protein [Chondrinema litorale]|uniref:SusC/RagA family TonB-linked outer membrane protein n=1 Tax=Chondrinema litorale TaxID=2994555 RepID=UPI002542E3BF|nr:SusC/RagA family TonB-linked outer membrane protein [Chondrinema litorale]UZR95520.1 SusC/RagA family TonB-linked outer membrane protein [Chondrinema litorale]
MRKLLLLLIFSFYYLNNFTHAQDQPIKGQVTAAEDDSPLVGVTVVIKNTSKGVTTNLDGEFTINASTGDELVFQMVGMQSKTVKIGTQTFIQVSLEDEASILDELVVTGFQELDRKLFTGASENVKMDDIKAKGMVDVSRMLEGQVAGVSVENVSGTFGTSPKIRIRGNVSINGNNQPLFVVDGVILEDLANVSTDDFISGNANTLISSSVANLNPSDIESFQILKDASATAIYGARAANGVIVITTKRGKSGKLRVNYSGNFSGKLRPTYNQFYLMNSAEEMSVYRELYRKGLVDISTSVRAKNYGALGKMFNLIANHELDWGVGGTLNEQYLNKYENANTDWFDVLFHDFGLQQQHSLSFTSGSEKSNSYYSLSYLNDQGQTIADNVQRFTGTARNTYFISDKFTFGLKLTGSYREQKAPGTRNREFDPITGRYSRSFDINPLSYALNTSRSMRPYDDDGELEFFRKNYAPFNILQELEENYIDIQVVDVSAQTDFEVRPIKNVVVKSVLQARFANTDRSHVVTENSNQAEAYRANQTQFIQDANNLLYTDPDNPGLNPVVVLPEGGFLYKDQDDLINFYNRNSVEYSLNLNDVHDINILAGQELRYTNRSSNSSTGLGVVYESGGVVVTDPNIIEFFNLQDIDYYSLSNSKDRFFGLFFNGGYAYKSRYVANFTVRYDGSNQLGNSPQARYLPTWNVSGAWNVHNEPFMENIGIFDNLKLRGTYGISGNLPPNASALLNLSSDVTIRPTDTEPYLFIEELTNTELTWEKLKEVNVGVDMGFLGGRINTSVDVYERQGFDLIGVVQTSGIGGQGLKVGNFADMQAKGIEASISTVNIKKKDFSWSTNLNFGYTKDKITRLDFGPRIVDAITQNGAAVLDGPRRGLFSTNFAGLTSAGVPQFYDQDGELVYNFDLQSREDLRETLVYEGPAEPRGAGGFTNTFNYKGFSLRVLLSFKFDYKIRLNDAFYSTYTDFDALPQELVNRWAVPGDEELTDIPVILDRGVANTNGDLNQAYELFNKSTARIADGSHVRLKTVNLSYMLPPNIVSRMGLSTISLSVEGQNLALLYSDDKLNGQDPEFFSTGGVALPQPRLVTFSLNIGL